MKKLLKITGFLTILALYCLSISFYSGNAVNYTDYSKNSDSEYRSSIVSSNLFCHTEQSESSVSLHNNISRTSLKNSFNQFSAFSLAAIHLLRNSYSTYFFYSENIVVRFKKTDIIFPFHYFW